MQQKLNTKNRGWMLSLHTLYLVHLNAYFQQLFLHLSHPYIEMTIL